MRFVSMRRALAASLALLAAFAHVAPGIAAEEAPWTTLTGRHVAGYQGWFGCPSDRAGAGWRHWFRGRQADADALTVDMWPDTTGFDADELCPTSLTKRDGRPAFAFSSEIGKTVDRHFRWMREHGLDGVALQRFLATISRPEGAEHMARVLANVRRSAARHGRGFFVMYDISGADPARWSEQLLADWQGLLAAGLTDEPTYWRHRGKPVLAIWGMGFTDRPGTAEEAGALLARLKETGGGVTLLAGVPTGWRTLDRDAKREPGWNAVFEAADIISPWSVGRFVDQRSFAAHLRGVRADLERTRARGQDYMPVVFPGFSFANAKRDADWFDRIPRRCGAFYWMQIRDLVRSGAATMLYTAMFDEVDEATAIMPVARTEDAPAQAPFVGLDSGGCALAPDWYLSIAGAATRAVRGLLTPPDAIPLPGGQRP